MERHIFNIRVIDLLCIVAGTGLMALATNFFFEPSGMVPGGFTGLAMIIANLTDKAFGAPLPVWLGNLLLNIPLILLAVRVRGWRFLRRTIFATLLFSAWLFLLPEFALTPDDMFLTAVAGGCLMGLGIGLIFNGKATTGGTDTMAAVIQNALPHLSAAKIMPVLDGIIILLSVWIFGLKISLYAIIAVVLIGRIADGLMGMFRNSYLAYIISDKYRDISGQIMSELDRGATLLTGSGMYTGSDRPVLFCAVSRKQAVLLKDIVYGEDPGAFMVITDASEIRGEGFLHYSKEEF